MRPLARLVALCALPLLAGCAASGPSSAGRGLRSCTVEAGPPLTLTIQVEARVPGQVAARDLQREDSVRAQEGLSLSLTADGPAHLYVVHRGPRGRLRRLYQSPMDTAQPAGTRLRVPEGDGWLTLDSETGTETFLIAASRRPFWQADAAACPGLGLRCRPATVRGDEEEPPPPPPGSEPDERGRVNAVGGLEVRTDPCGVALLRFPLRHLP